VKWGYGVDMSSGSYDGVGWFDRGGGGGQGEG
jgi:hypothetical protein